MGYHWSNCLYHKIQDCLSSFLLYNTSSLYPFPWTVEGNTRPVAHQRLHSPCTQCLCQCFGSDLYHQVPSSWRGQKVEWLAFSGRIHQDDYVFAWYVAKEKHFEHSTFFERCFDSSLRTSLCSKTPFKYYVLSAAPWPRTLYIRKINLMYIYIYHLSIYVWPAANGKEHTFNYTRFMGFGDFVFLGATFALFAWIVGCYISYISN